MFYVLFFMTPQRNRITPKNENLLSEFYSNWAQKYILNSTLILKRHNVPTREVLWNNFLMSASASICGAEVVTLHRHQISTLNTILSLITHNIFTFFSWIFHLQILSYLIFGVTICEIKVIRNCLGSWLSFRETASLPWPWHVWGQELRDIFKWHKISFLKSRPLKKTKAKITCLTTFLKGQKSHFEDKKLLTFK